MGLLTVVGQGLAGTLAALEAERKGHDFRVVDVGSGASATRAAAGLFNPITGPRFSSDRGRWDTITPYYQKLEQKLGVGFFHPLPLLRPWAGANVGKETFPRSAPGWSAVAQEQGVWVEGGGWIDLPTLVDAARARFLAQGRLEERLFEADEGRGQSVVWAGGLADFTGHLWSGVPGVTGSWQGVRGDVLTVRIPDLEMDHGEVGYRFLLPLGGGLFRWGATHESDVLDTDYRKDAKLLLERELSTRVGARSHKTVGHAWGVRPSTRTGAPMVLAHPDEPGWTLFNGFGGRGTVLVPRWLERLPF